MDKMITRLEKHYSLTEIRVLLGISEATIYRYWRKWVSEERINRDKIIFIGREVRVPESEVKKLIESFKVEFARV